MTEELFTIIGFIKLLFDLIKYTYEYMVFYLYKLYMYIREDIHNKKCFSGRTTNVRVPQLPPPSGLSVSIFFWNGLWIANANIYFFVKFRFQNLYFHFFSWGSGHFFLVIRLLKDTFFMFVFPIDSVYPQGILTRPELQNVCTLMLFNITPREMPGHNFL